MCRVSLTPHFSKTSDTFSILYPHFKDLLKLTHRQTESRHPGSCILNTSSRRISSLYGTTRRKKWSLHVWHSCILLHNTILSGAGIRRWRAYGMKGRCCLGLLLALSFPSCCLQQCSLMKWKESLFDFLLSPHNAPYNNSKNICWMNERKTSWGTSQSC